MSFHVVSCVHKHKDFPQMELFPEEIMAGKSMFDNMLSILQARTGYDLRTQSPFDIVDVDVKKDSRGNNRVVIATFADGTTEKAITSEHDTFNLEQGIQICVAKKAFALLSGNDDSSEFNKLVNRAIKLYGDKIKSAEKAKEYILGQEARAKKRAEKKAEWLERKKAKEREVRVNEMAEAYARAMKMVNGESEN